MSNLPALIDLNLIKLAVFREKIHVNNLLSCQLEGEELYNKEFSSVEAQLNRLNQQAVMANRGYALVSDRSNKPEAPEFLNSIFKDFCKSFHPDINPNTEDYFRQVKEKFDLGEFDEFLEMIDTLDNSFFLYSKWFSYQKKHLTLENDFKVKLGLFVREDKSRFYRLLADKWENFNQQKIYAEQLIKKGEINATDGS